MTSTMRDPIELLHGRLEEQFQRHTSQLIELGVRSTQPNRGGYDEDTLASLIASARRGVAETAQALRRMAEGSYGTCERCSATISWRRLEMLPQTRFCVSCARESPCADCGEDNVSVIHLDSAKVPVIAFPAGLEARSGTRGLPVDSERQ